MLLDDLTPSQLAVRIQKALKNTGHDLKLGAVQEAVASALGNGTSVNEFAARYSFRGVKHRRDDSIQQACQHCGSKLDGYYCSRSSCYYSNWPQHVPLPSEWSEKNPEGLNEFLHETPKRDPKLKEVYSIGGCPTVLSYRRRWDDVLLLRRRADDLSHQLFSSFADEVEASQVMRNYQRYRKGLNDFKSSLPLPNSSGLVGDVIVMYMRELSNGFYVCMTVSFKWGKWVFVFEGRKPPAPSPKRKGRRSSFAIPDLRFGWEELQRSELYWSDETLRCVLGRFVAEGERKADEWVAAVTATVTSESPVGSA